MFYQYMTLQPVACLTDAYNLIKAGEDSPHILEFLGYVNEVPCAYLRETYALGTVELTFLVRPSYHNQNVATRLLQQRLNMLEREPSVHTVWATCVPENKATPTVLLKLGFVDVGTVPFHKIRPRMHATVKQPSRLFVKPV